MTNARLRSYDDWLAHDDTLVDVDSYLDILDREEDMPLSVKYAARHGQIDGEE